MKLLLSVAALLVVSQVIVANTYNVVCFYDAASSNRLGSANFTADDLQTSLQLCTHVVYGYVGLRSGTFEVVPLDQRQLLVFEQVRDLKKRYSQVKFLLSLGGDKDYDPEKYVELLEGGSLKQLAFIKSAGEFLRKYQFDGLDLAYQLPRNKARKHHSKAGSAWKKVKKLATGQAIVDRKSQEHKQQLTQLIGDLKTALRPNKMMLTFTVLPNVNSSWYFNIPVIMDSLDFVNLAAFDFNTPIRNPKEADYLAPLYALPKHDTRNDQANVDAQIQYWVSQQANSRRLNMGVAAYGRTWKITESLQNARMPIVSALDGVAPGDSIARTPGLMSWAEVCMQVKSMSKFEDNKKGNYAYRGKAVKDTNGVLVTYEDVASVTEKAAYVRKTGMGGMALFDLSLDDFHGQCDGDKFALLKTIRYRLI